MDIKLNKLIFIFSIFSIHLIPFANKFAFETLPITILFFLAWIIFFTDTNFKNFLESKKIIILLIFYLILFYILMIWKEQNYLIELIKYLIGPTILLFYLQIKKYFGFNEIILFGVGIILLYFIFYFKIPILFETSCGTLEFFIKRLDCLNTQNLNRPFLISPEPSYLALMLSFYLIILNHFKENINENKKKILTYFVEILICFIIYQTSSRVGFIFLISFLVYKIYLLKIYKNYLIIISIFIITIFFTIFPNTSLNNNNLISSRSVLNIDNITSRFNEFLSPVFTINCNVIYTCYYENNLLSIINVSEPTGFVRIFHNILSIKGSTENNFVGYGHGAYSDIWYQHAKDFNYTHLIKINEVMSQWHPNIENKKQYIQNYFFSILHDGGIIPAVMLIFLIVKSLANIIKEKYVFGYIIFFYILITFFFQSTITSPYPWLALAIILFHKKKYA